MGRYRAETEQETARRFLMQADHAARLASAAEVLLNVPAVELTVTRIQDETIIEVAATSLIANPIASQWSTLTLEQILTDVQRALCDALTVNLTPVQILSNPLDDVMDIFAQNMADEMGVSKAELLRGVRPFASDKYIK